MNNYDIERIARIEREYKTAIQPYIDIQLKTINRSLPKITVYEDGVVEREFPEHVQNILNQCDNEIAKIAEKYKKLIDQII